MKNIQLLVNTKIIFVEYLRRNLTTIQQFICKNELECDFFKPILITPNRWAKVTFLTHWR